MTGKTFLSFFLFCAIMGIKNQSAAAKVKMGDNE